MDSAQPSSWGEGQERQGHCPQDQGAAQPRASSAPGGPDPGGGRSGLAAWSWGVGSGVAAWHPPGPQRQLPGGPPPETTGALHHVGWLSRAPRLLTGWHWTLRSQTDVTPWIPPLSKLRFPVRQLHSRATGSLKPVNVPAAAMRCGWGRAQPAVWTLPRLPPSGPARDQALFMTSDPPWLRPTCLGWGRFGLEGEGKPSSPLVLQEVPGMPAAPLSSSCLAVPGLLVRGSVGSGRPVAP